jgi:hypothetical protein
MTTKAQFAIAQVLAALVETIKAAGPSGAPGGVMYAALMTQGCTLEQFEALMGCLVRSGVVRKSGNCYFTK